MKVARSSSALRRTPGRDWSLKRTTDSGPACIRSVFLGDAKLVSIGIEKHAPLHAPLVVIGDVSCAEAGQTGDLRRSILRLHIKMGAALGRPRLGDGGK